MISDEGARSNFMCSLSLFDKLLLAVSLVRCHDCYWIAAMVSRLRRPDGTFDLSL